MVTAFMMTPGTSERNRLARIGVRAFLDQTYPYKELLILNHGDEPVEVQHPQVREVRVPLDVIEPDPQDGLARFRHQETGEIVRVGKIADMAIDLAHGDWVMQWDDDDYPGPERITVQMAQRIPGHCVVLGSQVRYSFRSNCAFVHTLTHDGIGSTILFPLATVKYRYPSLPDHFDSVFYLKNFTHKRVIVRNSVGYPAIHGPELFFRFHHGDNINGERHIMRGMAGKQDEWRLPEGVAQKLRAVLDIYEAAGYRVAPHGRAV